MESIPSEQEVDQLHAENLQNLALQTQALADGFLKLRVGGEPLFTPQEVGSALHKVASDISPEAVKLGPWNIEKSPEGQYLYIDHDDHPGDIHIKADIDGYVLDVWDSDQFNPRVNLTMAVEYGDLAAEPLETPTPAQAPTALPVLTLLI